MGHRQTPHAEALGFCNECLHLGDLALADDDVDPDDADSLPALCSALADDRKLLRNRPLPKASLSPWSM
jgi:hypothetical protein